MRTQLTLLTILFFTLVISCKKEPDATPQPIVKDFTLSSTNSLMMAKDSSGNIEFNITPAPESKGEYTFEVSGLPASVNAEFESNLTTTNLSGLIKMRSEYAAEGNYDVTLKATNKAGTTKETKFTLNITKEANCHNRMVGLFYDPTVGNKQLTRSNTANGLIIPDMYDKPIEITIDCDNHTFTMYSNESKNSYTSITKTGTGTFTPPNEISYSLKTTTIIFNQMNPGNPQITSSTIEFKGKRM